MIYRRRIIRIATLIYMVLVLLFTIGKAQALICDSKNPDEIPPFITRGVDPNLLMIIDNSASMYDLAYIADAGLCYDDVYDGTAGYAGYFVEDNWYAYENGQFAGKTEAQAEVLCEASNYVKTVDGEKHICLKINEDGTFGSLTAKGNFLNWAAASKLDIEKKILTGGKYDGTAGELVMESRGCLERRFIRKTGFDSDHTLTLAVRPPTDAEQYDVAGTATRIELFQVTATGYNHDACQSAIDEMKKESPNQGQVKGFIDDCMGYDPSGPKDPASDSVAAFNHSVQSCWYAAKQGWDMWEQTTSVSDIKNDCSRVYGYDEDSGHYVLPRDISPDHSGYVCFGDFTKAFGDPLPRLSERGYVGRCWSTGEQEGEEEICFERECLDEPISGADPRCSNNDGEYDGYVYQCSGNYNSNQDTCNKDWVRIIDCVGGYETGYVGWLGDDDTGSINTCVKQGLRDYCGTMAFPEVVDPSDQVTGTGDTTQELWNLPAMLVDSGVAGQMGEPLLVMKARISQSQPPSGLLQEFASDLRMGAMVFNWDGAKSECSQDDPYVTYQCLDPNIRDGGRIIASIGKSVDHTDVLVEAINNIVADTWTPLSEAMYNAVGYYAQKKHGKANLMRLNDNDFTFYKDENDAPIDQPITDWCQLNNILLITDGAPTADQNQDMIDFVASLDYDLGTGTCQALHGSSHLLDVTKYGYQDVWTGITFPEGEEWQTITTHVVAVGDFRDEGADLCSPDVLLQTTAEYGGTSLYQAETLNDLEAALREAFTNIRAGAAAGSAASVISATRSGEGAVYQAIFWPEKSDVAGRTIYWAGEVQALFVDDHGRLFEDTNGNRRLDADDKQVTIFHDLIQGYSRACYGLIEGGECTGDIVEISDVNYLWSANNWLSVLSDGEVQSNRTETQFVSTSNQRHIFTWYDYNGDGVVDDNTEILAFEALTIGNPEEEQEEKQEIYKSLGVDTPEEAQKIVNWLRGFDQEGLRSREININGQARTWRLGDVVHSTPTAVSRPAEGYHFLYQDRSYARFASRYNNRRHMIYFGGNDGMLHAVNGGFFDINQNKFCKTSDCQDENQALSLGAEVWAYVPYNLWPHLKCLADQEYGHKYYVDQVPRVFDVRIFEEESACSTDLNDPACIHPGGWGTILVGGMRFGGEKTEVNDRTFTSAYFILDITNPEQPPVLLGEMTFTGGEDEAEMGFTTSVPTVVPMVERDENGNRTDEWYLVMGSGPTNLKGESDQTGRVAVIDLKELVDPINPTEPTPFRIPMALPTDTKQFGSFPLTGNADSFVSDLVTVDFKLNYMADSVYFGTVSGAFNFDEGGWDGSGKLYRLVTEKLDTSGKQISSKPHEWDQLLASRNLENPLPLIDVGEPVTSAPAAAWDGNNYWIYFGTGRFFNREDLKDTAEYSYFGIKEPRSQSNQFTWEPVGFEDKILENSTAGEGLLRVDEIEVLGDRYAATAQLVCSDETYNCLPAEVSTFTQLRNYMAGSECQGWYRKFHDTGERNLGQATLLGGLLTFSSYLPSQDPCSPEGFSDLYALYYQTGTAWHRSVFRRYVDSDTEEFVEYRRRIGPGLAVTPSLHVGVDRGAKAFLQTSTGAIVGIEQPELPHSDYKTGRESWREIYREIFKD